MKLFSKSIVGSLFLMQAICVYGGANDTKTVLTEKNTNTVRTIESVLPHDTNLYYAKRNGEEGYLYFADPQPSEHGKNRVLRVNYESMQFNEANDSVVLTEDAYLLSGKAFSNPHSIDRAGKTNKFYVRTQNAYSFDVVDVRDGKFEYDKTIPLFTHIGGTEVKYSPRAFGAYNAKYDIQLLSGKNTSEHYAMVGIVDVKTDKVIKHIAHPIEQNTTSATGHARWLDENHFAVIDRGNHAVEVYKVFINDEDHIDVKRTSTVDTITPLHTLERINDPQNSDERYLFFGMAASGKTKGKTFPPSVEKFVFDPKTGRLTLAPGNAIVSFSQTDYNRLKKEHIPATTHHAAITEDGKYIIVPVFDGKIYKIDIETMNIVGCVTTCTDKGLGAGHVEFSETLGLAVITNHWSPYLTIIDMSDNKFELKGYLKIYKEGDHDRYDPESKHLMQPHFAHISEDGQYFYTFASQDDGRFVKIDLEKILKLERGCDGVLQFDNSSDDSDILKAIYVGGAPEQAHS